MKAKSFLFPMRKIALLFLGLLLFPPWVWPDDWPMFRRDLTHTGLSRERLRLPFHLLWKTHLRVASLVSSPAVVDGVLYIGTTDDPNEGGTSSQKSSSAPVTSRGSLYALSAKTGKILWRFKEVEGKPIGPVESSPAVVGGRIYFSCRDGYFYCLDKKGQMVWRTQTGGTDFSSPAVSGEMVYFGSGFPNTHFLALDAQTGKLRWKTQTGDPERKIIPQMVYSSPAVDDKRVYIGAQDAAFYALDKQTGKILWRYQANGAIYHFSPTLAQGKLLVATGEYAPTVRALEASTGKELWVFRPKEVSCFISSIAVEGDTLFIGMGTPEHKIYALDIATGKEKWSTPLSWSAGYGFTSSPALAGDLLVVGSPQKEANGPRKGYFFVLDTKTGKILWQTELSDWVLSSPAIAEGKVFVASIDGTLYCFGSSQGAKPASVQQKSPQKKASGKPKTPVRTPPSRRGKRR